MTNPSLMVSCNYSVISAYLHHWRALVLVLLLVLGEGRSASGQPHGDLATTLDSLTWLLSQEEDSVLKEQLHQRAATLLFEGGHYRLAIDYYLLAEQYRPN